MKICLAFAFLFIGMMDVANAEWSDLMEDKSNFEGDIELNSTQFEILYGGHDTNAFGLAKRGVTTRWPTNVPIAYVISDDHKKVTSRVNKLKRALADYEKNTCLRFKERTGERAYINFATGSGCSSPVGMQYAGNFIRLAGGCFRHGTLLHEIAHTLGIWHEQSRPDRDQYIKVRPENMGCCSSNFRKMSSSHINSLGFDYDLESMMHYGMYAFSNGNGPTIEPLDKTKLIGQRRGFSPIDIKQINAMYCNGAPGTPSPTSKTQGTPKATTTPKPTAGPKRGKIFKQVSSNMCLEVDSTTNNLVFTSRCQTRFMISEGAFWKADERYMRCGTPENQRSNSAIKFKLNCKDRFSRVQKGGNRFVIKHGGSGKCIHPRGGSSRPSEGTEAVIYHDCNSGSRIQFEEI